MSARPVIVTTTILKPRAEVYSFWRNWKNLPQFSPFLKSVEEIAAGRTQWVAKGPTGDVKWEAETTVDEPNTTIGWRSLEGADVANAGRVDFADAPGDRGTEVKVSLSYDAPGGKIGAFAPSSLGSSPSRKSPNRSDALKRFSNAGRCRSSKDSRATRCGEAPNLATPRRSEVCDEGRLLDGQTERSRRDRS